MQPCSGTLFITIPLSFRRPPHPASANVRSSFSQQLPRISCKCNRNMDRITPSRTRSVGTFSKPSRTSGHSQCTRRPRSCRSRSCPGTALSCGSSCSGSEMKLPCCRCSHMMHCTHLPSIVFVFENVLQLMQAETLKERDRIFQESRFLKPNACI